MANLKHNSLKEIYIASPDNSAVAFVQIKISIHSVLCCVLQTYTQTAMLYLWRETNQCTR